VTLLYPFVDPARLDTKLREGLARVARAHEPFTYRLASLAMWPDTLYVAVDPVEPFVSLQGELQTAFPGYPIYGAGSGFEYEPDVTIAEGTLALDPAVREDPAWRSLPGDARASRIDVIATSGRASWRTVWRIPLGR
jgi:2'-5' RNA ligase superfamily